MPIRVPAPKIGDRARSFLFKRPHVTPDEMLRERNEGAFADLERMRERFIRLNRKLQVSCSVDGSAMPLELCLASCEQVNCSGMNVDNLKGPNETKSELVNDIIKLQRIVNILYHGHDDGKEKERDTAGKGDG